MCAIFEPCVFFFRFIAFCFRCGVYNHFPAEWLVIEPSRIIQQKRCNVPFRPRDDHAASEMPLLRAYIRVLSSSHTPQHGSHFSLHRSFAKARDSYHFTSVSRFIGSRRDFIFRHVLVTIISEILCMRRLKTFEWTIIDNYVVYIYFNPILQ